MQHGYFYAQEFLPDNDYDVRVMIIGRRALALRRFNRPGEFRASGSGTEDFNPRNIDQDVIRLSFGLASRLDITVLATDVLRRGSQPVVGEFSPAFPTKTIHKHPGYWRLCGEPDTGELRWIPGTVRAEDMIFEDFVNQVRQSTVVSGIVNA